MDLWSKIFGIGLGLTAISCDTGSAIRDNGDQTIEDVICNSPYIRHGSDCCLDQNINNVCDGDENITEDINDNSDIDNATNVARDFGEGCIDVLLDEGLDNLGFMQRFCYFECGDRFSGQQASVCKDSSDSLIDSLGKISTGPRDVGEYCVNAFYDFENGDIALERLDELCFDVCSTYELQDSVACYLRVLTAVEDIRNPDPRIYVNNIIFASGEIDSVSNINGNPDQKEAFFQPGSQVRFCFDSAVSNITIIARTGAPCSGGGGSFEITAEIDGEFVNPTGRSYIITPCVEEFNRELELDSSLNPFVDPSLDANHARCFGINYNGLVVLAIDAIAGISGN